MGKFVDITGQKFGRLQVKSAMPKRSKSGSVYWECLCDCGNSVRVVGTSLRSGNTRSCGCYNRERAAETTLLRAATHGKSKSPAYYVWESMKSRCTRPRDNNYKRYGGRGIKICDEWLASFEAFYEDMGDPPEGYTLGRINNNGPYCKENCRWETCSEQARNRSNNTAITLGKVTKLLVEWLEFLNMSRAIYYARIKKSGLTPEQALSTPIDLRYSRSR